MTAQEIKLGAGVLTWDGNERRSDRYGTVYLIEEEHSSLTAVPSPSLVDEDRTAPLSGRVGTLIANVTATRASTHAGDKVREVYPRTPKVGERIVLGNGTLFTEPAPDGGVAVGLRPKHPKGAEFVTHPSGIRAMVWEQRIVHNDDGVTSQVKMSLHDPWLDVRALYDAHEQSVELVFIPSEEPLR